METKEKCSLSFLDVDIKTNKNKFSTSVYRKSTFSGLGISYFSFWSCRFKINSITTLLHRAFNICSNYHLLHDEFKFLCNFFVQNGFPELLVQSKINKFLNSKHERGQTVEDCGVHRISLSQFNIIGSWNNIIDLRILESLHILINKPKINE